MFVIFPLLCFALFVAAYAAHSHETDALSRWGASFLAACVTWGIAVTGIMEMLSRVGLISFGWLLTVWLILLAVSMAICSLEGTRARLGSLAFPATPRLEYGWVAVTTIAFLVGLVAYLSAPNNPDSLFYHMARVLHWIQNQTVAHYPTNILFQLFYPPWAEFAILHLHVLSGGDHWSNLVQWMSMVGSIIGSALIARQLGADARGQMLAAVMVATIPMGVLQAASTQNDYVTAFWLVALMYYVLRFQSQPGWKTVGGVGASLGLSLLTKSTAYIYAFPIVLWFTFMAAARFRWKAWQSVLLIASIALTINMGHYARNFELWGNPLGIDRENSHPNKRLGIAVTVSNVIRNMSVHLGTRSQDINKIIYEKIGSLHEVLDVDVHDPLTTITGSFDQNWLSNSENRAGNPIHLILVILSLGLLLSSRGLRGDQIHTTYAVVLTGAFLIFCSFLKWEVWHSRLHLPLFVLWSPLVSAVLIKRADYLLVTVVALILSIASTVYVSRYAIPLIVGALILWFAAKWHSDFRPDRILVSVVSIFLISASTWYVFDNHSRPILGQGVRKSILNVSRTDQLFLYYSYRHLRQPYQNAAKFITDQNCSNVGLSTGVFGRQYLFWVLLQDTSRAKIRMEHVNVANVSAAKSKVEPFAGFSPCAVIVANSDDDMPPSVNGRQYVKAWSSGPVRLNRTIENVSVLVPKVRFSES
jgi:hypothetical protein